MAEGSTRRSAGASQAADPDRETEYRASEDIAMFDHSPLPDRSVRPRPSRPLHSVQFQDWKLSIELRHGTTIQIDNSLSFSLQDPCIQSASTMMPDLVAEKYQHYHLTDYHPGLISFDQVVQIINDDLQYQLDLNKHELGYILPSPGLGLQSTYSTISSKDPELSLRSALSSMFNCQRLTEGKAVFTLYLWDPIPTMPITFLPGSDIADAAYAKRKSGDSSSSTPAAPGPDPLPSTEQSEQPSPSPTLEPAAPGLNSLRSTEQSEQPPPSPILEPAAPGLNSLRSTEQSEQPPPSPTSKPLILGLPTENTSPPSPAKDLEKGGDKPDGIQFNINDLLKSFRSEKPRREDFPDDDEGYKKAMRAWHEEERERELEFHMADTTKCQQLESPNWTKACRFLYHSPDNTDPEWCVVIPGFGRKLLPIQGHSVWWALQKIHGDIGGVMICHSMGIGKTTIAFAIHHVQHTINRMWDRIWANPEEHRFSDDDDDDDLDYEKSCPSQSKMLKEFGFDCPCCPGSSSYFVKEKLGISVGLVPLGLIDTWKYEWEQCFKGSRFQKLMIAHGSYESKNESGLWTLLEGKEEKTRELATDFNPAYNPAEGSEEHNGPSKFSPRLRNGNCFVLSTSQSIGPKFLDHRSNRRQYNWILQEQPYLKSKANDPIKRYANPKPKTIQGTAFQACFVSTVFKDEFQHQPTEAVSSIKSIITSQFKYEQSNIALVPMSGTPLTSGPLDIARYVQLMVKPIWREHPVLRKFMGNELQEIGERWRKAILRFADNPAAKDLKELRNVRAQVDKELPGLVETLFVRSTTESKLSNSPVIKVPLAEFRTIYCEHEERYQLQANDIGRVQQEAFEQKEATRKATYKRQRGNLEGYTPLSKTNVNTYYRSRVCATFPALASLTDKNGELLKLTFLEWDEKIKTKEWKAGTASDPYFTNLDAIVKSSGKLVDITKMLEKFGTTVDGENKPTRHIFISYFFVVVYVFQLWMRHYQNVPEEDIITINEWSTPTPKKKTAQLDRFHVDLGSNTPVDQQKTARFVIATSSAISIGLTLAEAISVSFLEPDYNAGKVAQGFARHCRQGNKNKKVYCNIFLAKGNKVEGKILEISNLRKTIDAVQNRKQQVIEVN